MQIEVIHFRIFGSRAWLWIPLEKRKDLDPQNKYCIFVGYPYFVTGYRILNISKKNDLFERSVYFDEIPVKASKENHVETFVLPSIK